MITLAFILTSTTALASIFCGVVAMVRGSALADFYQHQFFGNSVVFCFAALVAVAA